MMPNVRPYSRATVLVQAFVDGKAMLRCRETGSMDGLLLQCNLPLLFAGLVWLL